MKLPLFLAAFLIFSSSMSFAVTKEENREIRKLVCQKLLSQPLQTIKEVSRIWNGSPDVAVSSTRPARLAGDLFSALTESDPRGPNMNKEEIAGSKVSQLLGQDGPDKAIYLTIESKVRSSSTELSVTRDFVSIDESQVDDDKKLKLEAQEKMTVLKFNAPPTSVGLFFSKDKKTFYLTTMASEILTVSPRPGKKSKIEAASEKMGFWRNTFNKWFGSDDRPEFYLQLWEVKLTEDIKSVREGAPASVVEKTRYKINEPLKYVSGQVTLANRHSYLMGFNRSANKIYFFGLFDRGSVESIKVDRTRPTVLHPRPEVHTLEDGTRFFLQRDSHRVLFTEISQSEWNVFASFDSRVLENYGKPSRLRPEYKSLLKLPQDEDPKPIQEKVP